MFDSSSDNEHDTNTASQLDTTTDSQLLMETRNEQLQEELALMTKNYNNLRAQFEQAVKLTQSVDKIHSENEQLKVQIRELGNEKQDLIHRLEIATLARDEMMKKHQEDKQASAAQRDQDVSGMQKEFEKVKQTFKSQIDSLYKQLQSVQQSKEKEEVAQKTLISRIEKLIENCSVYLACKFTTFEEICSFFENQVLKGATVTNPAIINPAKADQAAQQSIFNAVEEKTPEISNKIKALKAQLKEQIAKNRELEDQILANTRATNQLNNKHKDEIDALNAKITQINEDNNNVLKENKRQIKNLETKLAAIKESKKPQPVAAKENEKPVSAAQPQQQQQQPQPRQVAVQQKPVEQPQNASAAKIDLDAITAQYTNRISELQGQLDAVTKKYNDALELNKNSEHKCGELLVTLDKNASELLALKRVHDETVCEIESIRKALHAKEENKDKKSERERRKEQQKQKAAVICLEKSVEALKKQMFDQQYEKEGFLQQISERDSTIKYLQQEIKDLKSSHERMQGDLADATNKLEQVKIPTESELIPTAVWTAGDFENSLQTQIEKIAETDALSAAAKIQHIYRIINKFFNKKIDEYKKCLDEAYGDYDEVKTTMNDFLVSLTIALMDNAITLEEFIDQNLGEKVVAAASQLRSQVVEEKRHAEMLQAVVDRFNSHFGSSDDVNKKINMICDEMEHKKELILRRTKKCKAYKQALNDAELKITAMERDHEFQMETKDMALADLEKKKTTLEAQVKALKDENKALKEKHVEMTEELDTVKSELEENKENLEEERRLLEETIAKKHEDHNNELQSELSAASQNAAELSDQCNKLKKALNVQKQLLADREQTIADLKANTKKESDSTANRHELEKKQIIESYEKAVREITAQCEAHRGDVEKLSVALATTDKKLKQSQASTLKAKRMKVRAETEIKALEEQLDREKKLSQSALKNAAIANESDTSEKVNQVKAKAEEDKRKLISIAAQEFSQFFNAGDQIDERSFKTLIGKAKDEINRLTKMDTAIRRLVGASGKQATDDAVAQALIN